jgi:hypothetical protein
VSKLLEQTIVQEEPFRANFKQSVKGIWTVEFSVRAGDVTELNNRIGQVADVVLGRLDELNAGDVYTEDSP